MHPMFHVILATEKFRVYTVSLLLEEYISSSNEPRLLNATDLNVSVCFWVLVGIKMSPARAIMVVLQTRVKINTYKLCP